MSGEQKLNSPSKYVKLNVGGSLYYTTIDTLTKHETKLKAIFTGKIEVVPDSEGFTVIERSGKHFDTILNFLRDGSVALPDGKAELTELYAEARYYSIHDLVNIIEPVLKKKEEVQPKCVVPLLTSHKEEQMLLASSRKPVIKLTCNRHNNKYSYTNYSDDNFLKNLELFDKLSLQFGNRLLLIKDVIGTVEICCWYFYGHSQKIAEVCCTSIVYGTDKKHTKKESLENLHCSSSNPEQRRVFLPAFIYLYFLEYSVEYPEARIFEETLNVLLYENLDKGPDAELMKATRGGAAAIPGGYHSDDDMDDRLERVERLRRK